MACFQNAAAHLEPGGCFVIEVGMPDLQRLPPGETVRPVRRERRACRASTSTTSRARGWSRTTSRSADGEWRALLGPVPLRLARRARPHGRLAGMRLRERWADWDREPYTSESRSHVSVWERRISGSPFT